MGLYRGMGGLRSVEGRSEGNAAATEITFFHSPQYSCHPNPDLHKPQQENRETAPPSNNSNIVPTIHAVATKKTPAKPGSFVCTSLETQAR